jgi:hypothetical protein
MGRSGFCSSGLQARGVSFAPELVAIGTHTSLTPQLGSFRGGALLPRGGVSYSNGSPGREGRTDNRRDFVGNYELIRRLQILLTWILAGKYYRTRLPAPPVERRSIP